MPLLRVEFHCHTIASKDSLTMPSRLVSACRRKGLDRVIVTDHNSVAGARAAQSLDPELVIVGEEIMTTRGEILAAFVKEEIPPSLAPAETIRRLRAQGAFISVSHPFDRLREGGWQLDDLLAILPSWTRSMSQLALHAQASIPKPLSLPIAQHAGTVGSDAHAVFELGRSIHLLEQFEDADGLRRVIRAGQPVTHWSPPWFHLSSRYASLRKKLGFNLDMPL
jgi:hypothetical protein